MYYLLENIIHYYYCQSEGGEDSSQWGEDSPPPFPPTIVHGFRSETENFDFAKNDIIGKGISRAAEWC